MATLDLLTLDEAREALGAKGADTWDTRLTSLNTAVSVRLDEIAGPIVARAVTEYHDGGCHSILPRATPILTFTSVTEYQGTTSQVLTAETVGTAPQYGYLWQSEAGVIFRRASGYDAPFWVGRQNIRLVFSAGRYATTSVVGERFKEAAAITLAHVWRAEKGSGNVTFGADGEPGFGPSFAIPRRALELIGDQKRIPGIA